MKVLKSSVQNKKHNRDVKPPELLFQSISKKPATETSYLDLTESAPSSRTSIKQIETLEFSASFTEDLKSDGCQHR